MDRILRRHSAPDQAARRNWLDSTAIFGCSPCEYCIVSYYFSSVWQSAEINVQAPAYPGDRRIEPRLIRPPGHNDITGHPRHQIEILRRAAQQFSPSRQAAIKTKRRAVHSQRMALAVVGQCYPCPAQHCKPALHAVKAQERPTLCHLKPPTCVRPSVLHSARRPAHAWYLRRSSRAWVRRQRGEPPATSFQPPVHVMRNSQKPLQFRPSILLRSFPRCGPKSVSRDHGTAQIKRERHP